MRRRQFLIAAGALLAAPLGALAQQAGRVYRVGILRPTSAPNIGDQATTEMLLSAALRKLGYIEGRNLVVEDRYAEDKSERLSALARELIQMPVDVIVAVGHAAVVVAKKATSTIPIIMYGNFDPVALGYVVSLARPEGNVTGVLIAPDGTLGAKKLELLKAAVPGARRIAVLAPEDPSSLRVQLPELRQAAAALRVELAVVQTHNNDYADALARIAATHPDALFVIANTYFVRDRKAIIELVTKYRLPTIWEWREQVEDGGLMSYGSSRTERYQRVAEYIDRILKGGRPGDMPVNQPTTFELVINMKTAKAIGLALPQALLQRADRVIE